jgi:predicted nuclease of predicted toxin-antitoxin system
VLQVRGQDVLPDHLEKLVVAALRQHEADLASGALVVVDESKSRVRILPI